MYGFYPTFADNAKNALDDAYANYLKIVNGDPSPLDAELVQRGNSGVPISYGDIRWKEYIPFTV